LDVQRILAELEAERSRIEQAISAIANIGSPQGRRGRPAGQPAAGRRRKRRLTALGRKRLANMTKRRWAKSRAPGLAGDDPTKTKGGGGG
jgi:hypothetical protein